MLKSMKKVSRKGRQEVAKSAKRKDIQSSKFYVIAMFIGIYFYRLEVGSYYNTTLLTKNSIEFEYWEDKVKGKVNVVAQKPLERKTLIINNINCILSTLRLRSEGQND